MSLAIATYNVLATAYIRQEFYPHTPAGFLTKAYRVPALRRYIGALPADIYCLQEVEADVFEALEAELAPRGYEGRFALKSGSRPDGCATFVRHDNIRLVETVRLPYDERVPGGPSGHIAQLLVLEAGTRRFGVANTHLKWDSPEAPEARHHGLVQIQELLAAIQEGWPLSLSWLVCGDFNVRPTSRVVQLLLEAGYQFLHSDDPLAATCNANGRAKMIDYIFFPSSLRATAAPLAPIRDTTPLPSDTQPSDHIPVLGWFEWT